MTPTEQAERFQIITSQIEKAISEGAGVICLGDWNIDLEKMNHESYRLKKVAEVFKSTISNERNETVGIWNNISKSSSGWKNNTECT